MRGKRAKEIRRLVKTLGVGLQPYAVRYSHNPKTGQIILKPGTGRSYYQDVKRQYIAGGQR